MGAALQQISQYLIDHDKLLTALIAGLCSMAVGIVAGFVTLKVAVRRAGVDKELPLMRERFDKELAELNFRLDNRTLFAAENAAITFLNVKQIPSRSFHFIRHRLRGFKEDELRQILVRAGAVQFTGDAGEERWGLWNRNQHLDQRTGKEQADLGAAPRDKYREAAASNRSSDQGEQ
jgi:hypothetical protein